MSTINWPIIVGVFASGAFITIAVIGGIVQARFRAPKKRTDIANIYTDKNIKILQQQWAARYRDLEEWHDNELECAKKHDEKLTELYKKLNETRLALRLLTNATEQSIEILKEAISEDQTKIVKLENAIVIVQKIISRP